MTPADEGIAAARAEDREREQAARERLRAMGLVASAVRMMDEARDLLFRAAAHDDTVVMAMTVEELDALIAKISAEATRIRLLEGMWGAKLRKAGF